VFTIAVPYKSEIILCKITKNILRFILHRQLPEKSILFTDKRKIRWKLVDLKFKYWEVK
jgi:hypothetical protein